MTAFKVGDRVRHKYAPATCVGVVLDARGLETRVRVDPSIYDVPQPDERWIPNYNLEHCNAVDDGGDRLERVPVVDEVESAKALIDNASRAAVLAYREKVLAEFRAWDMRPSDTRTWHAIVMGVEIP